MPGRTDSLLVSVLDQRLLQSLTVLSQP